MKKTKIFFLILITIVICSLIYYFVIRKPTQAIHYHAGFLVYVDGKLQNFSLPKYMKTEPCLARKVKPTKEEEQKEKAHLHDDVGDVVHVHRDGAIWGDLFKNIDFIFPASESATGYANGAQVDDVLNYPIKSDDSVIIVFGSDEGVDLETYINLDHIKEIESRSETCGS
jgi:hypothetical protein